MRKNILQSHSSASQLQSRLNRHRYISKQIFPGGSDAKVFNALKKSQHIPDRKIYPNIYHWYILIRQFSDTTRAKWIANQPQHIEEEDTLVKQLINEEQQTLHAEKQRPIQNKQENIDSQQVSKGQILLAPEITPHKQQANDLQFFLNICSRENLSSRIQEVTDRTARERENKLGIQVTQIKLQDTSQGKNHFIYFKTSPTQCEQLKDKVSQWSEVLYFSIKKLKKNAPRDSRILC